MSQEGVWPSTRFKLDDPPAALCSNQSGSLDQDTPLNTNNESTPAITMSMAIGSSSFAFGGLSQSGHVEDVDDDALSPDQLGLQLWLAAQRGSVSAVKQLLKANANPSWEREAPPDLVAKQDNDQPFPWFLYKGRVGSCQPLHIATIRKATQPLPYGFWVDQRGKKKQDRALSFCHGSVICIRDDQFQPEGFKPTQHKLATYMRSGAGLRSYIEVMHDKELQEYEIFLQKSGTLRVADPIGERHFWDLVPADLETRRRMEYSREPIEVVELLLQAQADVNAKARIVGKNSPNRVEVRRVCAIHLAAASGNVETIDLLVRWKADPRECATLDDRPQYEPVHDAAWYNQSASIKCLLALRADINATNNHGMAAIHLAAKLGYARLVEDLLMYAKIVQSPVELLSMRTPHPSNKSPIDFAVEGGQFPPKYLHVFTKGLTVVQRAQAFLSVAQACPPAASALLRSWGVRRRDDDADEEDDDDGYDDETQSLIPIDKEWRASLRHGSMSSVITPAMLAMLIERAPRAAIDLLDALADHPKESSREHYPVPIRATVARGAGPWPVSSVYEEEDRWTWEIGGEDRTEKGGRFWHDRLVKTDPQKGVEVTVRIVRLRGIACVEVLHALALTPDQKIFTRLVIHALLNYVWTRFHLIFLTDFSHSVAVVVVLTWWITWRYNPPHLYIQVMLWSTVASHGLLQFIVAGFQFIISWKALGWRRAVIRQWELFGLVRVVFGTITLALAFVAYPRLWLESPDGSSYLAVNSLTHWLNLLFQLRGFRWTGQRLLPIAKSVQPIVGMLVIMAAILAGFMYGFWAMDIDSSNDVAFYKVASLLLTGEQFIDSDDLHDMEYGRRLVMIFLAIGAVFVFLACALNIFIAVLGDCYDLEQERMVCSFQKERARLCSGLLMGPTVPLPSCVYSYGSLEVTVCLLIVRLTVGALLCMLPPMMEESRLAIIPAVVMTVFSFFNQACLRSKLTRGWDHRFLWLCNDKHIEDESNCMSPEEIEVMEHQGRMARMKRYIFDLSRSGKVESQEVLGVCRSFGTSLHLFKQSLSKDLGGNTDFQEDVRRRQSNIEMRQKRLEHSQSEMKDTLEQLVQMVANLQQQPQQRLHSFWNAQASRTFSPLPQTREEMLAREAPCRSSARFFDPDSDPLLRPVKSSRTTATNVNLTNGSEEEEYHHYGHGGHGHTISVAAATVGATHSSLVSTASSLPKGRVYHEREPGTWQQEDEEEDFRSDGEQRRERARRTSQSSARPSIVVGSIWISGCEGRYRVINGEYRKLPQMHAGRHCWASLHERPYYLFHSGKSRWVISRTLGDCTTCYAFANDEGFDNPSQCRLSSWMRCDDLGRWSEDPKLLCSVDLE